jgi:2-oxoglutarate ferredoxin oxidoreductase subunit alpha
MKDISIVLCGEAGQGIQTVQKLLSSIMKLSGLNVFSTKEFMSRIRGGSNSTLIRLSTDRVSSYIDRMDILIPLSSKAVEHVKWRLTKDTILLGEEKYLKNKVKKKIEVPFTEIAYKVGNKVYANTVAVGTISGLLEADVSIMEDYIKNYFKQKDRKIIEDNVKAAKRGFEQGKRLKKDGKIDFSIEKNKDIKDNLLISGTEAIGLGAIAGGCNFIASYPMSPSTGVLVFLASQAEEFGIVVEQAESEIAAINMVLGAWYAGARGLVTTSGGGFALMVEGLSLSGMLETPVVIHLAQRPGPATGLPTRTEQGDLLFALFSGHGEFPRIILSPGTPEDAFYLSRKAFNLADKHQVPVFIITDQYLLDSSYTVTSLEVSDFSIEKYIAKTKKDYRRYEITENGISPRGIPGYGDGLVCVDSDEHNKEGHITEDLDFRVTIVDKRLKKLKGIIKDTISPELIGKENYKHLVVGWGSTYHCIKEALSEINNDNLSFLHFKQVYPLHPETKEYLDKAENLIVIENNATGQFGKLIKLETDVDIENKILKYNGLPFSVEELVSKIKDIIGWEETNGSKRI